MDNLAKFITPKNLNITPCVQKTEQKFQISTFVPVFGKRVVLGKTKGAEDSKTWRVKLSWIRLDEFTQKLTFFLNDK